MSGYNADRAAGNDDRPPHGATTAKVAMVVYVPASTKHRVKVRAAQAGVTMSEWVEALVGKELNNEDVA